MSTNKGNLVVLSEYYTKKNHVGFSLLYDLDSLFNKYKVHQLVTRNQYEREERKKLLNRFRNPFHIDINVDDLPSNPRLLVICSTPRFLLALNGIKTHLKLFESVAVYFVDGFDSSTMDGYGEQILRFVSRVYTPIEEIVEAKSSRNDLIYEYLPFGIDALQFAPIKNFGRIDIYNYGRSNAAVHEVLEQNFNKPSSSTLYLHSTFKGADVVSQSEHRRMHWNMLLNSKIALCFESSQVKRFCGRSPVLYRWFECLAAGNVIVGTRPKCQSAKDLIGWQDATLELPAEKEKIIHFFEELLADEIHLKEISDTNKRKALELHDWRYRLKKIFDDLDCQMSSEFLDDLAFLEAKAGKP